MATRLLRVDRRVGFAEALQALELVLASLVGKELSPDVCH